ncbi:hypothetical protein JKP88DRAFT_229766 [Tribonema minus]|uniref:Uncharacterized protein n=1 Tax=Tribonema minus TaxID=303371 RepID=A0A836CN74_9STRA|nr:hypothetical protein JKP88DRAFT_229766 [Tribonema minus]
MMKGLFCVVAAAFLATAFGFQGAFVARPAAAAALTRPAARLNTGAFSCAARRQRLSMQFGGSDEDKPKITREAEPEDFFATNLDKASTEEKLKDPLLLISFGWLGLMAVAATAFILIGVQ